MKKQLFVFLSLFLGVSLYAQDKVVLKNGEELNVKVVKNDEKTIEFQYPGESMVNVKNKREIKKIVYESGREETINVGIEVPVITSADDWEKVVETYLESDVEGLTRVDEIKATSGWGGALGSSLGYKGAIRN